MNQAIKIGFLVFNITSDKLEFFRPKSKIQRLAKHFDDACYKKIGN